ncbi:GSCOCG00001761001-RA-CDS [Cotesia congregata]|uniref:Similar to rost: Protein rolling stone (Drosophila melanogaster) n=1 Tax=Cotesia congregata TaxID=51543 RepID=A0A8J2HLB3_COTCN|nr:GSCOCG00001761001-RA-CDS [Cotesia congregata]CAG5107172.1 Similar to rost: Protein rolling stone (Drosophila melanogaster) [Cotesia congregata]
MERQSNEQQQIPPGIHIDTSEFSSVQLCINPTEKKKKDSFCLSTSFCGPRAMVNKLWCRKISRAWLETKQTPPHPRLLTESRFKTYAPWWYVYYRWFMSLGWISIVICSVWEIGSTDPLASKYGSRKWFAYLTNWHLTFGVAQTILGATLVTRRWLHQRYPDFNPYNIKYTCLEKSYWFLYSVTASLAIGVTAAYWIAIYDPKIHFVDSVNLMQHALNSILIIVDLFICAVPIRLRCFWWTVVVIVIYLIFSVIYYSAGGLDRKGFHYIYKILDWKKPGISLLVSLGGIGFIIIVHCLLTGLTSCLERITKPSDKSIHEPPLSSANNEQRTKVRDVEIV